MNTIKKHNRRKTDKKQVEEPKPEPTTKICPFCLSEIPYKASKCCHCTSELNDTQKEEKTKDDGGKENEE